MTDAKPLHDIAQKLRCWGYLSHHPDAEHDVAWLLERLAEQGGGASLNMVIQCPLRE